MKLKKTKGKLIVIEGTDGSGKTTQYKLLLKKLKERNFRVKFLDFPQYGTPSCGAVEKYLNGKYGSAKEVGPYRASIFYAVDRYDASFITKKWLKEGCVVIANRYVASNLAHQGGKLANFKDRKKYYLWNEDLEYNFFKIPHPDLNIILYVPPAISQKMVDGKGFRKYLGKKKRDIHEADLRHLTDASRSYLELAKLFSKKYHLVNCVKNGSMMSRAEIAELVWKKVKTIL